MFVFVGEHLFYCSFVNSQLVPVYGCRIVISVDLNPRKHQPLENNIRLS